MTENYKCQFFSFVHGFFFGRDTSSCNLTRTFILHPVCHNQNENKRRDILKYFREALRDILKYPFHLRKIFHHLEEVPQNHSGLF